MPMVRRNFTLGGIMLFCYLILSMFGALEVNGYNINRIVNVLMMNGFAAAG